MSVKYLLIYTLYQFVKGKSSPGINDCHPNGNDPLLVGKCQLSGCHDSKRDDGIQCCGSYLGVSY